MVNRDRIGGKKQSRNAKTRRRGVIGAGAGVGVFLAAAAAMATGSAAPAKADFEDLLDPIIQPILTQVTDSLSSFDPTLGTDLSSWTDTFLADLNSLDPTAATGATAAASAAQSDSSTTGTYDLPITFQETTEPTVQATVDGANTTDLVDTGSSGLVIPETDLGSNFFTQLEHLIELGVPSGIHESGYSGGVDYIYLTYDNASVDYATTGGGTLDTTAPVEVEIYSWDPGNLASYFENDAFQNFLNSNDVTGILGIGTGGGAGESPIEAAGFTGVTVDEPDDLLIVGDSNAGTPDAAGPLDASGSTISGLTETVTGSGTPVSTTVDDDVDSGGVYGTIPSSLAPSGEVPDGDTITVSDGNTPLYSYLVANDGQPQLPNESPITTSGDDIDSGYAAYEYEPVYIDYTHDTLTFDEPAGAYSGAGGAAA